MITQEPSTQMKSLISIFLSEASRASPFQLQDEDWRSRMKEGLCSLNLPEYLKQNVLHFLSLKTFPLSERFKRGRFLRPSSVKYLDWGMCANGSVLTVRLTFPKSRKRVFIVGYLDPRCAGEILPLERKSGTPLSELTDRASQGNRVYDAKGAAITLTASCGGFGGKTGMYFVDMNENSKITDTARCITARHNAGLSNRKGEHSGVFVEDDGVYPVINPDREKIRQNGPRVRKTELRHFALQLLTDTGLCIKAE